MSKPRPYSALRHAFLQVEPRGAMVVLKRLLRKADRDAEKQKPST